MTNKKNHRVKTILGFEEGYLPATYLGIPLVQGRVTQMLLRPLVDKIKRRAIGWAGSMLFIQGRAVLIQSVLSSISIYSMGIYKWPASVIKEGERILRNFLWSREPDSRKAYVVAWDKEPSRLFVTKVSWCGGLLFSLTRLYIFVLRYGAEDFSTYLFWECLFSIQLWNWMAEVFLLSNLNRNLPSFLWAGNKMSLYLKDLWAGAVWGGSFLIWKAHNNCLYEGMNVSFANEKRKWINQIHETAMLSTSLMHNSQSDLAILHCLGVAVHSCNHPMVKSCYWELPRIGKIKINTDGDVKGNHRKRGIGCIIRDYNGCVLGTLSKGLGLVTNFMAECEAIIHGVENAASFGWLIAWIESDSMTTVKAFKTNNIPWILEAAWENARRNMRHIRFSANWREANFSTDALSNKGALLQEGVCETKTGRPVFLKKIEVPMQEYFRFC
ncbi:hypothetical protein GIB67_041599 [Kingdonia uniflora]|uniref:RNase H type-1 domain-containing protein n=1 Tax=Kingdonia uniflora TaxID=39325 RepID=A0A7J7MQZ1_9MAGN|nr:hypothetical protein GIB67_041599 [Kingdonia uniflora]